LKKQKALSIPVAVVLIVVSIMAAAYAAGAPQAQGGGLPVEPQLIQGKIAYMERLGGYYIQGIDPPGEVMIDNPNQASLQPLAKNGKLVHILGRFTVGADHIKIEKIDGKPYPLKQNPK
jgi:hypothetical protein